jgi:hypothetical protein
MSCSCQRTYCKRTANAPFITTEIKPAFNINHGAWNCLSLQRTISHSCNFANCNPNQQSQRIWQTVSVTTALEANQSNECHFNISLQKLRTLKCHGQPIEQLPKIWAMILMTIITDGQLTETRTITAPTKTFTFPYLFCVFAPISRDGRKY